MLRRKYFVVSLIAVCLSHVAYASDYNNYDDDIHDGGFCEIKIPEALADTNRKLDAMDNKVTEKIHELTKTQLYMLEKTLPERLEKNIENNFNMLETKNRAIQDDLREKINKLEDNLLDKLQVYLNEKFNSLEQAMHRNMEKYGLEKKSPDGTDTGPLNKALDTLKKVQVSSDGSVICTLSNNTSTKIEENLNQKLNTLEKTVLNLGNTTTHKFNSLDNNLINFKDNLNQKLEEMNKAVPNMEENIKRNLDALSRRLPEHFEENISLKLDTIESKIINKNDKIHQNLNSLDKRIEQSVNNKLDEINKKIPKLEKYIKKRMDTLQNIDNNVLTQVKEAKYSLGCKEHRCSAGETFPTPYYQMDDKRLKHVVFRTGSAGLSYLEMHLAVRGNDSTHIMLASKNMDIHFQIAFTNNTVTLYRLTKNLVAAKGSGLTSSTRYIPIYVKIDNGTLAVGKANSKAPLISYKHADYKVLKYFSFGSPHNNKKIFLYDCPPNVIQHLKKP